jgi:hypothetical protein
MASTSFFSFAINDYNTKSRVKACLRLTLRSNCNHALRAVLSTQKPASLELEMPAVLVVIYVFSTSPHDSDIGN